MSWTPIAEAALQDLIHAAEARMDAAQARFWAAIRIPPAKWGEPAYGTEGGGFWAVAVIGTEVVWYNDIEDGFNRSPYRSYGVIGAYGCEQAPLEVAVQQILDALTSAHQRVA